MAERPVVWISHRAGERCAGCAAEVFTGDFVQITGETGGILWNCLLGRHPGDMETYGRLLTRRSGRWHDQIDKSPTCHRMELWRRTGSTTYARAYGRPWLRTTPEAHDPS
jgi:hypothetical protein